MSEKLASAEIDESRERFEKAFDAKYYTADQIAKGTMADLWEQAERDTRERIAQLLHERAEELELASPMKAMTTTSVELRKLAERIRGVNR